MATSKTSDDGRPRLRADAIRSMEKLRTAAAEAFASAGLGIPLDDIARRAGVSVATIYNRFGSREGLLDAVVSGIAADRLAAVKARSLECGDAWESFACYVTGICEDQAADPAFNDVITLRYPNAAELHSVCEDSLGFGGTRITQAQASGALRGDFTRDDLARIFWVNGQLIHSQPGDTGWRRHLAITLDGLRSSAASHPLESA